MRVRVVVICLAIGVVVTTLISWAAILVPLGMYTPHNAPTPVRWPVEVPDDWGRPITADRRVVGPALTSHQVMGADQDRVFVRSSGWPWRALSCAVLVERQASAPVITRRPDGNIDIRYRPIVITWMPAEGWQAGLPVPESLVVQHASVQMPERRLPIVPVLPGFALNVIAYATIAWLVLFAPRLYVRHVRRCEGQCAACGYDLAGLSSCPECGIDS